MVDLGLQPLVLAAPDVGELDPLAPPRRLGVEVDRQVEPLRDPLAERPGQLDRLVHRRVAERNPGDDVDRADPGVLAGMLLHVDLVDRRPDEPLERVADAARRPGDREDGAVVAGVTRPVEEMDAVDTRDRRRQQLDDFEAAALGDVRDGLDEALVEAAVGHGAIVPSGQAGRAALAAVRWPLTNLCKTID
jgi:hypothetical protein